MLHDRELLIEKVGIRTTDRIQDLVERIEQLEHYLDLIPVFQTKGWHYEKAMRPPIEELKSVE